VGEVSLPASIGPYRVLSELGRGMMGVVYKAEHKTKPRLVALKVIRFTMAVTDEQRETFERRFLEEARIVARLDHAGIVAVIEIGADPADGAPFIAFEYLEGRTLGAMIQDGPLAWRDALRIVAKTARALHHAHEEGVVHRDIKPANIMVLPGGEPKIMDFGLAKREAGVDLTSTGQFLGTPMYMSPEQALARKVDARTDVFSLGAVAYTMLTGHRAFEAESIPQVMNKVTYQHPAPPRELVPTLPPDVDYLLARAMAKSPDDRHPTAKALAEDVEDILKRRKPRHRARWKAPEVGEGTLVSGGRGGSAAVEGAVELTPLDPPTRRRGGAGPVAVLGLSMLALGAVLYSSAFWKDSLLGIPELPPPTLSLPPTPVLEEHRGGAADDGALPIAAPTAAAASPETLVDVTPEPSASAAAPLAAPTEPAGAPTALPTDAPTPSPTAAPTPAPTATAAASPRAASTPRARPRPEPSRLSVSLEHGLKAGTLRVWVDNELVMDQRLSSRVTKDLLVFKTRSGKAQDVLMLAPGSHRVRVEVKAERDSRSREVTGVFKAGAARSLDVRWGRAKGELGLTWK
jgi:predicted Ser/Thr protein kinase